MSEVLSGALRLPQAIAGEVPRRLKVRHKGTTLVTTDQGQSSTSRVWFTGEDKFYPDESFIEVSFSRTGRISLWCGIKAGKGFCYHPERLLKGRHLSVLSLEEALEILFVELDSRLDEMHSFRKWIDNEEISPEEGWGILTTELSRFPGLPRWREAAGRWRLQKEVKITLGDIFEFGAEWISESARPRNRRKWLREWWERMKDCQLNRERRFL